MAKLRKMLTDINAHYLQSIMRLVETQSNATISGWCISYAEVHLLPLWAQEYPADGRPAAALHTARRFLEGECKLPEVKQGLAECRSAARESGDRPIAQGAARAIDSAVASIHNPSGCIGIALYGALTLAYSRAGTDAPWEELEALAAMECARMEEALRAVAITDEPNPAKIKWNC